MLRVVQYIHIGLSRLQIDPLEVNSGLNKIGGRTVARGELKLTPDVRLCYRISKSCNANYSKYKVKNKTQYVI